MLHVAILTIGDELTGGRIQDTNTSFIARACGREGWKLAASMAVGDDEGAIKKALDYLLTLADAVVVTGGLGPTADDITTESIAKAFGLPLIANDEVLAYIKTIFVNYNLVWTDNNAKQAVFPAGAEIIPNPGGTAAGFALHVGGKVIAVIPGVPREAERMFPEGVVPLFKRAFPEAGLPVHTRTIKIFGVPEAKADELLADIDRKKEGVEIGFYPRFPEIHLVLSCRTESASDAKQKLGHVEAIIEGRLSEFIFAYDDETMEGTVAAGLTDRGLTIAVAESCTGGLICDRLTDVPGSSGFLERGFVTYSNAAKTELLGVPQETLEEHGAVSEPTARLMAEGARKNAGTDLGLSVTGIAGPTGGSAAKPVGTVFIALADKKGTSCRNYSFRWDRRRIKQISAQAALLMVRRYLRGGMESV
ncbi:MAG: competence/damage-inducible protein A [Smithellaceae bacterium]|nr:competence/damage-inducible protein A [Smithellaceae bacterium]